MTNLPDTLQVLLAEFASMAWSKILESMILGLPDFAWLLKFSQPD